MSRPSSYLSLLPALALASACDPPVPDEQVVERAGDCSPGLVGVASTSGHWASGTPDRALDGDPATAWLTNQSNGAWLALDLGAPRQIDHVRVQWRWDYNYGKAASSVIETSLDGVTWTTAATTKRERMACIGGEASCLEPETLSFAPVSARHVRFRAVQWNGGWGQVQELSVHSPCTVCTAGACSGVFVFDDDERRAVVLDEATSEIELDPAQAQRLCTVNGEPKLTPGTLLLAGPQPEVVDNVAHADPSVWNNAFGFARELVHLDCQSAPVVMQTVRAQLDRAQYGLSSAHLLDEQTEILQRPPAGPEPKKPTGMFIPLAADATPVGVDIEDLGPPPGLGAPPMPPILPPISALTGLNACTTPQPLELGEGDEFVDPKGFLPPSQWVITPKVIQGQHELEAEVKIQLDGEVRMQVEPCIDLKLDPAGGSTGHIGFNLRWAGRLRGKYEGKGVYKRKFEIGPNAVDDQFLTSAISRNLARKGVFGMWVLWVPTPAGVPLPVVIRVYPVLELEFSAGGEGELESELTAKGVHFAGVRVGPGANGTEVTPYYGGNNDADLEVESGDEGAKSVVEVRANLKLEVEAALLDSLAAKAAIVGYTSAEQTTDGACGKCKLELGGEAVVGIGGHLPLGLAPDAEWEVEWALWNEHMEREHPGTCSALLGAKVPGLDPALGVYPIEEQEPVGAPKRCPFAGFVAHGHADLQGRTQCGYPSHWPYVPRPDLWGDTPGKQHILEGDHLKPDVEQLLVEVWMQAMGPEGTNLVSMAPGRGWPQTTHCTPWFLLNTDDPTCPIEGTVYEPRVDFVADAPGKPTQNWLYAPTPSNDVPSVSYIGDFLDYYTSYFNVRVVGVKWADGEVQYAKGLEYCEGFTAPTPLPPLPPRSSD